VRVRPGRDPASLNLGTREPIALDVLARTLPMIGDPNPAGPSGEARSSHVGGPQSWYSCVRPADGRFVADPLGRWDAARVGRSLYRRVTKSSSRPGLTSAEGTSAQAPRTCRALSQRGNTFRRSNMPRSHDSHESLTNSVEEAADLQRHRSYLIAVSYRILGPLADTQDAPRQTGGVDAFPSSAAHGSVEALDKVPVPGLGWPAEGCGLVPGMATREVVSAAGLDRCFSASQPGPWQSYARAAPRKPATSSARGTGGVVAEVAIRATDSRGAAMHLVVSPGKLIRVTAPNAHSPVDL